MGDRVGSLEPGLRADLTALDLAGSPLAPVDDPEVAAVLGGSSERVLLTVVDGVVRYRRSADAERVAALVAAAAPGRARLIGQDG
jgi:cytosine/adenosine deaminase-related metal-dependent hydrolase